MEAVGRALHLRGIILLGTVAETGKVLDTRPSHSVGNGYHQARPFPGVRELFEHIRAAGQRAVLASSGTGDEVHRYQEIAGIADLIDSATSSDDAERSKPFPDIFQAALAKLEPLGPDEAVVIGDTPYDAEAARQAGMTSVGVLCGGFPEEALRSAGCIAVFEGPGDLLKQYDRSPLGRSAAEVR